jgi:SAM-dependent methyltransferase
MVQQERSYQFEYYAEKKILHKNMDKEACFDRIFSLLGEDFKQANIFTAGADYQILAAKNDKPKIIKKPATKTPGDLSHNQPKHYLIPDGVPCDFLIRLGVMQADGLVHKKHYAKFRQINKFLEIVEDALKQFPKDKSLRIVDFGCGKAYLTFALYYYLRLSKAREIRIVGLDLKADVIAFCNQVARDLNYEGLEFQVGDIADYTAGQGTDLVVTLHACDTATDFALIKAVSWDASVILSVPCCQHELFDQLRNKINGPMLKHGLLKERFTAILTDTLRGLKLEEKGYEVSMIEFTSLEHTAKNIMIKGIKTGRVNAEAKEDFDRLVDFWQVSPTISQLL